MEAGDDDLDDESGFPALVDWKYDVVIADLERHRRRTVVDTSQPIRVTNHVGVCGRAG